MHPPRLLLPLTLLLLLAAPGCDSRGEHKKNRALDGWSAKELRSWADAAVASTPAANMKLEVRVPPAGKRPGDVMNVTLPNGEQRELTLPDYAEPGKLLRLEIPQDKPKNPDWKDLDGRSLLLIAALMDNVEVTRILIAHGANVNAQAGNDEETLFGTPLIAASWKGHKRIVKMLLNAGADPNAKGLDPDERTPLIAAAERGYIDIVKLLLDSGADVHAKGDTSETGETALTMAIEKGRQVKTHRHHFDMHRMHGLKPLPGEPGDENSPTQYGVTALHAAVSLRQEKVVHTLLYESGLEPEAHQLAGEGEQGPQKGELPTVHELVKKIRHPGEKKKIADLLYKRQEELNAEDSAKEQEHREKKTSALPVGPPGTPHKKRISLTTEAADARPVKRRWVPVKGEL